MGILGLGADPLQAADFTAEGGDGVLGRVQHHGDDVHALFPVGKPHAADDVVAVLVQQLVQGRYRRLLRYDDADKGDSGFHVITSRMDFSRQKSRIASSTRPKDPPWGGRFSLWRIFRRKKRLLASGAWLYCRIKPGGCQGRGGHKSPGDAAISHTAGVFHGAKPHFSRPTERISLQKAKPGGLAFCVHFLSPSTVNAPKMG